MAVSGLEGVVVADTSLSEVDGQRGRLVVRGFDVERLAAAVGFEEVCALLWTGDPQGLPQLRAQLGEARQAAFAGLAGLGDALEAPDGMDALRTALGHLRLPDPLGRLERFARITGALTVYAAAWARRRDGLEPLAPDPGRAQAEDALRMTLGREPEPARARALGTYLATVAEHGMNASTFTARVVASTRSDPISAVVAALGALKGPLHGGAPGPVLDMLDAIESPAQARPWLEGELAAGRRIMGMGHRVYRVRDPRAAVLERCVEELERAGLAGERLTLARAVEAAALELLRARHPERPLAANVEFYTAVLLETIGLDRRSFAPTFACGRVAGWLAHVAEQQEGGRIIRPRARYVGPRS